MYVLYFISYLLITAGFFNDGFTGIFFSLPFIAFLALDSLLSKNKKKFIINLLAVSILFILSVTRFSNPYIYPILNKSLITSKDYKLTNYRYDIHELVDIKYQKRSLEADRKGSFETYMKSDLYQEYLLKKGTTVKPLKVIISGHPDILGASYDLQIDISDTEVKSEIQKYISSRDTSIIASNDIYAGDWFFDNFSKENIFSADIKNIFEKNLCQAVMIFHPFLIWIYFIILFFQLKYLNNLNNTRESL